LVESRRLGATDAQLLEDYPHLSASDLKNAWAYAEAFPDEIEAAIKLNDLELISWHVSVPPIAQIT
jgi:uncharacterized protein (DUF433 family)